MLDAIRACWGSLFTARALVYRLRKGISHHDMPIAVGVIEQDGRRQTEHPPGLLEFAGSDAAERVVADRTRD